MEVPALGSPRDIIFRGYLSYETRVEIKKQKLMLLQTIGTPFITDANDKTTWDSQAKAFYSEYVDALIGRESAPAPEDKEAKSQAEREAGLRKFYEEVVQKTNPKLSRDGDGRLHVAGLPSV